MSAADFIGAFHTQEPWFFPMLLLILGGVFGSFITCCAYRVPRGLSLRSPGSYCPKCETPLGVLDLIPVFSFFLFGQKCRHCHEPIPLRYGLIELFSVILSALVWLSFGLSLLTPLAFVAMLCGLYFVSVWFLEKQPSYKVLLFILILLALMIGISA